MAVSKRYYFWLFKAYFKRWSKIIFSSVIVGAIIFFIAAFSFNYYVTPLIENKIQKVGLWGTYTVQNIPQEVLGDISYGLTRVNADGSISPAASYHWDIKNDGKVYVFYIKKGQYFDNKTELTAKNLPYNFKDVKKKVLNDYQVEFDLREAYAPFLSTVSKPILDKNLLGLGEYKIQNIDLNGGFVKSIKLQSKKSVGYRKIINFYPSEDALKTAYALGEIDRAIGTATKGIMQSDYSEWKNTGIEKNTDYHDLVTVFFNTSDPTLSNKKVREAFTYAMPATFPHGLRAFSSINPASIFFSKTPNYGILDLAIAQSLLESDPDAKKKTYEITTTQELKDTAVMVSDAWKRIGIKSKIKIEQGLPSNFQVLIYPIKLPTDPDQYTLWHSGQINNITKFRNLRIDKLLEDGRSTNDIERRVAIYSDFQKYLIDEAPAAFLYFPYAYNLIRK